MVRSKCPNGTRKNKQGDCIQKSKIEKTEPIRKRCPKGTHKNKSGECVPKKQISRIISPNTPRKEYVKKYFDKPIQLLGKTKLFQVSFQNPEQFINHTRITEDTNMECFIQTLFSLGLRDRKEGKQDLERIKGYNQGVLFEEAVKYIKTSFALKDDQLKYVYTIIFSTGSESKESISKFFNKRLVNNYAAIFSVTFKKDETTLGHYVIAYKYNDIVNYFDPQQKIHTTNPEELSPEGWYIAQYGYFRTINVEKSMKLKNTTCPIEFFGGNEMI